jgi:hypothetical protein
MEKTNQGRRGWAPKYRSMFTVLKDRDTEWLVVFDDYRLTAPQWVRPIKNVEWQN